MISGSDKRLQKIYIFKKQVKRCERILCRIRARIIRNMPHIFRTQFLYVLVTELDADNKIDTRLRIVHWQDNTDPNGGYFVVYGNRPTSVVTGEYNPYRVRISTIDAVVRFVKHVWSIDSVVSVELHQFDGLNDDTEDALNVDWDNTAENGSSELVAFDSYPILNKNGRRVPTFKPNLRKLLTTLAEADIV